MRGRTGIRRLWIFDFDGTLSLLVSDRNGARLHPASRALLVSIVSEPGNRVAVLSSRSLEDLSSRVTVPGLFLGGASGLEWRLPGGRRILPGDKAKKRLEKVREAVLPEMARLSAFPGVGLEDKRWSMAVHFRHASPEARSMLAPLIENLKKRPEIRVFGGPAAAEVLFFRSADKTSGVRRLCRFLGLHPSEDQVFYAGDDENDAAAMRWVVSRKGMAIAVGNRVRIPGIPNVAGPARLARAVRELAGLSG